MWFVTLHIDIVNTNIVRISTEITLDARDEICHHTLHYYPTIILSFLNYIFPSGFFHWRTHRDIFQFCTFSRFSIENDGILSTFFILLIIFSSVILIYLLPIFEPRWLNTEEALPSFYGDSTSWNHTCHKNKSQTDATCNLTILDMFFIIFFKFVSFINLYEIKPYIQGILLSIVIK